MKILITGGTGALGQEVARAAEEIGHDVRIGSRRALPQNASARREWAPMDLATGEGIPAAVSGVDAVVHAASDPRRARAVDVNGTRLLVEAALRGGASHLVYSSIVGIDEIPLGYYRRKLAAERIIAQSGISHSILRATQFHTLVDLLFRTAARAPLAMPLPTAFRVQSVAPSEVAERLVGTLAAGPGGRLADLGGPEVLTLGAAAEQWKQERGFRKPVMRVPIPGRVAVAYRLGKNTVPAGEQGTIRWRDWFRTRAAG